MIALSRRATCKHTATSGPGTRPDRVRPGTVQHDLLLRADPLRCGICDRPSDRAVCYRCEALVKP